MNGTEIVPRTDAGSEGSEFYAALAFYLIERSGKGLPTALRFHVADVFSFALVPAHAAISCMSTGAPPSKEVLESAVRQFENDTNGNVLSITFQNTDSEG
ncbi:hypothetical protein AB0M33_02810 [Micrococcus luteus]|uniref:hypothetical protein n=1 Tax=Actinomycetes TaxID=1760 RepID=UPI0033326B9C